MSLGSEDGLDYKLLTRDQVEAALAIQRETMHQENLAIGVGMFEEEGAPEEMTLLFREVIKDGCTLIAVDTKSNTLAAVAFNKIHARPREGQRDELEIFIEGNLKLRTSQGLVKFLDDIESSVDIFERYKASTAMELFYLGTNPQYQGRGIGRKMVHKCIDFARGLSKGTTRRISIDGGALDLDAPPELIFGVFASNFSQRIADKVGFETLHEIRYDDYVFDGKTMAQRIGSDHKTAKFQALKL
ncbi:uncharacterized protein LOC108629305 isoform X1 [Ceratina calcarata]|uniref:Uncharacterized protein LOC108629305 isoform X1 n=1 Tax=Ceratina calcarata TaxID=156304 RepID=A0AAJ7NBR5_9HYME|nr:uncharacterized protein LOC108629305 isoform X1 [Ceratina calcarata]